MRQTALTVKRWDGERATYTHIVWAWWGLVTVPYSSSCVCNIFANCFKRCFYNLVVIMTICILRVVMTQNHKRKPTFLAYCNTSNTFEGHRAIGGRHPISDRLGRLLIDRVAPGTQMLGLRRVTWRSAMLSTRATVGSYRV